jgi:hypothetical protein
MIIHQEMLRFTGDDPEVEQQLTEALNTMLAVLQYLNASMHQVRIVGYNVSVCVGVGVGWYFYSSYLPWHVLLSSMYTTAECSSILSN